MRQNNMDIVSAMATIRNDKHAGRQRNLFVGILMLVILGILLIALVTGVTVYQRVASVQDADLIIVMDNGTIADMGRHDELYARSPIYREVYQQQTNGGERDE